MRQRCRQADMPGQTVAGAGGCENKNDRGVDQCLRHFIDRPVTAHAYYMRAFRGHRFTGQLGGMTCGSCRDHIGIDRVCRDELRNGRMPGNSISPCPGTWIDDEANLHANLRWPQRGLRQQRDEARSETVPPVLGE